MKKQNDTKPKDDAEDLESSPKPVNDDHANWEIKAAEYLEGWKRAKADLENMEKRQREMQSDLVKFANAEMVVDLLPVVDNFERAFGSLSDDDRLNSWVKGFEYILQQLLGVLNTHGVIKFSSAGELFDPEKHEAIEHVEGEADKVIEEVVAGYTMHGKVIRHAKVKVGKGKA